MRQPVVNQIVGAMGRAGCDAVICSSPENFAYVTGFVVPSQSLMRWRHAMAVVKSDASVAILAVDMEESTVRAMAPDDTEIRIWGEFTDDPIAVLAALLEDMGLGSAAVGIEMDYLPAGDYRRLAQALPRIATVPVEGTLAALRQIKTAGEIELMRMLARNADAALAGAYEAAAAGDSEMDLAAGITRGVYTGGADQFKLLIVATGERSVYPNVGPSERRLAASDVCRCEVFSVKDGYHAGVCRTAYVERAPEHAETIWKNLDECKHIVLDMLKPGASSRAIYDAFTAHLAKLDLPPISFIGHGIGLQLHEEPYLGKYSDTEMRAGMVLGIEPLVYDTGHGFGMQNKDIVLVTDSGCELLSDVTDTTRLIRVA